MNRPIHGNPDLTEREATILLSYWITQITFIIAAEVREYGQKLEERNRVREEQDARKQSLK